MIKIIEGKRYNTDTAKQVGYWSNNLPDTDFKCCAETLYKTVKGVYFLHGQGGAGTDYRDDAYGGGWCEGEAIIPMTDDEALEWMGRNCSAEAIELEFGDRITDV